MLLEKLLPSWRQLLFLIFWIITTQLTFFMVARKRPYSSYYNVNEDLREGRLFKLRDSALQALADLRAWKTSVGIEGPLFNEKRAHKLCIGIISYGSGFKRHLSQTVGSLFSRMPSSYRDRIRITIFNASYPLWKNHEAIDMNDVLSVKPLVYPEHFPNPESLNVKNRNAKQLLDYSLVLRALHSQGCTFGLVLKEGALAGRDWASSILDLMSEYGEDPGWVTLRLMAEYGLVKFSLREPGDFIFILSSSASLVLLVWGLSCLIFFFLYRPVYEDLTLPSISSILVLLLASFYIGFILLGKPNFPPNKDNIRIIDTGRLAVANLYPSPRLVEYAQVLEEHFREMVYQHTLKNTKSFDNLYPVLKERLERREGEPFYIVARQPSLFQNIARDPLDPIGEMLMSEDWPDNNRPITFDQRDFLEMSGFKD